MLKNTKKWKDRGWWMSVEIDRKSSGRKNESLALDLLGRACERYDLLYENGKTVSRGIFTREADMLGLAGLLELANRWTGTVIYSKGNRLGTGDVHQLTKLLNCAANQASCRSENRDQRLAYLGCHLLQIGLMNYSLASLKNGGRYWFSYLKSEKGGNPHTFLDKYALAKTMATSQLCPLFPSNTPAIIEMLPSAVNLRPKNNHMFWVPTRQRIRTSWLCRFPPVVPYSEAMYRQWMKKLFSHELTRMTTNY
jgi:hypothetical protein